MSKRNLGLSAAGAVLLCAGCAYLGFHGPSVRAFPEIHEGVTEDQECLECHRPGESEEAPATPHPGFAGCLKCHRDPLRGGNPK